MLQKVDLLHYDLWNSHFFRENTSNFYLLLVYMYVNGDYACDYLTDVKG